MARRRKQPVPEEIPPEIDRGEVRALIERASKGATGRQEAFMRLYDIGGWKAYTLARDPYFRPPHGTTPPPATAAQIDAWTDMFIAEKPEGLPAEIADMEARRKSKESSP